jgi:hypothetical protein
MREILISDTGIGSMRAEYLRARMEVSSLARWQKCDPAGAKFVGYRTLEPLANTPNAALG